MSISEKYSQLLQKTSPQFMDELKKNSELISEILQSRISFERLSLATKYCESPSHNDLISLENDVITKIVLLELLKLWIILNIMNIE